MPKMENYVRLGFEDAAKEQMKELADAADRMCKSVAAFEEVMKAKVTIEEQYEKFVKEFWRLMPRNQYEGMHCMRLRNSSEVDDILRVIEEYVEKNPNDQECRDLEDS